MMIRVLAGLLTVIVSLCSGNNFPGPRNITRTEGTEREIILCQPYPIQATPFWKINGTISDVPSPFVASRNGREIIIPVVDLTLSGTSFQCFIPSSSGDDFIRASLNAVVATWRALHKRRCIYYQLATIHICGLNSDTMVLINRTNEETITLEAETISNFTYFHLTAYDAQSNQHEDLYLETFQFGPGNEL